MLKIIWNETLQVFEIPPDIYEEFDKTYPLFRTELNKMRMWYKANPKKHKKDLYRFMVNWLNKTIRPKEEVKPQVIQPIKKQVETFGKAEIEKMISEAAPPPDEWREMLNKMRGVK